MEFEPRLAEGRWLAEHFPIHSMIDLSDGLAGDLRHLLERGRVGAELLAPRHPDQPRRPVAGQRGLLRQTAPAGGADDGEDYELLFTVAGRDAMPLADAWRRQFPKVRLSCIGKITAAPGLKLRDEKGVRSLEEHGYVHFA